MSTQPEQTVSTADPPVDGPGFWDKLETFMDEHMGKALGKLFDSGKADVAEGKPGGDPAPGRDRADVSADVKREVAKLRDAEAKEARERSMEERVRELEDKLKAAAENAPEEFRWITEKMWK